MKKNTKLLTAISTTAIVLSLIAPAAISVSAAQEIPTTPPTSVSTPSSDNWSNADNWSPDQIANFFNQADKKSDIPETETQETDLYAQINPYIKIVNNLFTLVVPQNVKLSTEAINYANVAIKNANQAVQQTNSTINVNTKTAVVEQGYSVRSAAKSTSIQWNGVQNIYRTNAAIWHDIYALDGIANGATNVSLVASAGGFLALIFPGIGGVPSTIVGALAGAQYVVSSSWAGELRHGQNTWPKNKISWIVYWGGWSHAAPYYGA